MRVWDLAAGGAALFVLEGHTGECERADGLRGPGDGRDAARERVGDKTLRVWDASKGGAALRVVPFDDEVNDLGCRARHERALRGFREAVGGVARRERHDATDASMLSRVTSTQ